MYASSRCDGYSFAEVMIQAETEEAKKCGFTEWLILRSQKLLEHHPVNLGVLLPER